MPFFCIFPKYVCTLLRAGPIPRELGKLASLQVLILLGNQLSGELRYTYLMYFPLPMSRMNPMQEYATGVHPLK